MIVGDDFPKNAFLTSMFCPVGVIVLLLEMRKNGGKRNFRKLAEFFVAALVLFVVSINFVGWASTINEELNDFVHNLEFKNYVNKWNSFRSFIFIKYLLNQLDQK